MLGRWMAYIVLRATLAISHAKITAACSPMSRLSSPYNAECVHAGGLRSAQARRAPRIDTYSSASFQEGC